MSANECTILQLFRRYQAGPDQMLFFQPSDCKLSSGMFQSAMQSLVRQGLVIKERPKQAYSLTAQGYSASLHVEREAAPVTRAKRTAGKALAR